MGASKLGSGSVENIIDTSDVLVFLDDLVLSLANKSGQEVHSHR